MIIPALRLLRAFSGTDVNMRMERIWKIKEVSGVGMVEVRIPDSYDVSHLLVNNASNFLSGTEYAMSDNGDGTMSAMVDFANGDFFTFAKNQPGPGGLAAGLELWLKADTGVTEASGDVSAWGRSEYRGQQCQSGYRLHAA